MTFAMGLDVGGTKIEAAILDAVSRQELFRKKIHTPKSYDSFIDAVKELVAEAERFVGEKCSVGMGFPSIVARDGTMRNYSNLPFLRREVAADIEKALRRKIKVANDANCLALSETVDGAAFGYRVAFCAILGTGVGAGITIDGKIISGIHGFAGEWGHISQPYPLGWELGQVCSCGSRGHMEALNCAPALVRIYNAKSEDKVSNSLEITERSLHGDKIASQILDDFYNRLARAFVAVSNILDPDVFVLGGGLSLIDDLYVKVPAMYTSYMQSINGIKAEINLKRAKYGSSSGLRGAAWL